MGLLILLPVLLLALVVGAAVYLFSLAASALRDPKTKRAPREMPGAEDNHGVAAPLGR